MPVLAARFLVPLADIRPVTTTRLDVPTGSRDVVQSESLRIEADVARLEPSGLVSLFVSEDGGANWSRTTMEPIAPTRRARRAASRSRSRRSTATCATTSPPATRPAARTPFACAARRRSSGSRCGTSTPPTPAAPPLTVVNTDGLIEAPVGTRATLTITATEPLDHALLTVAGEKILMERVDEAIAREPAPTRRTSAAPSFTVRRNGRYTARPDQRPPGARRRPGGHDADPRAPRRQAARAPAAGGREPAAAPARDPARCRTRRWTTTASRSSTLAAQVNAEATGRGADRARRRRAAGRNASTTWTWRTATARRWPSATSSRSCCTATDRAGQQLVERAAGGARVAAVGRRRDVPARRGAERGRRAGRDVERAPHAGVGRVGGIGPRGGVALAGVPGRDQPGQPPAHRRVGGRRA